MSQAIAVPVEQEREDAIRKARLLMESTVILDLQFGKVATRKKIDAFDEDVIETTVERDVLHVSVDLFKSAELKACFTFMRALKAQILKKCVPSHFMRGGMYLVKLEHAQEVDTILEEAIPEFRTLVRAFADVIDQEREDSKERLGPAYRADFFPSREAVLDVFRIEKNWIAVSTPTSLQRVSASFFERERAKAEEHWSTLTNKVDEMLAAEAKGLCEHLAERLTPDADGKAKRFKKNSLESITEYLKNFSYRNLEGSSALTKEVARMEKLMEGISPEDLRQNDQLRDSIAKGFSEVAISLDSYIVKPSRMFALQKEIA